MCKLCIKEPYLPPLCIPDIPHSLTPSVTWTTVSTCALCLELSPTLVWYTWKWCNSVTGELVSWPLTSFAQSSWSWPLTLHTELTSTLAFDFNYRVYKSWQLNLNLHNSIKTREIKFSLKKRRKNRYLIQEKFNSISDDIIHLCTVVFI